MTQAFLVGYDAAEEDAVAAELGKNKGIIIMQPIPDDHWIVKAKPSEIEALQATFPSVTVVSACAACSGRPTFLHQQLT